MDVVAHRRWGELVRKAIMFVLPHNRLGDMLFIQLKYFFVYREFIKKNSDPFSYKLLRLNNHSTNYFGYEKLADKLLLKDFAESQEIPYIPCEYVVNGESKADYQNLVDFLNAHADSRFLMKGSLVSGENYFIDGTLDFESFKAHFKGCSKNMYQSSREIVYKADTNRVYLEKVIADDSNVYDAKIHVFNGKPLFLQVDTNRFSGHLQGYFTIWDQVQRKDMSVGYQAMDEQSQPPNSEVLKKIRRIIDQLNLKLPYVRIDFLVAENHVYIGELTFYPWGIARRITPQSVNNFWASQIPIDQ